MTEDQKACVAMLEDWAYGKHHLPEVHNFGNGVCINYRGDLSTFDFDRLTSLVLLAHRDAIRVEIASSGPGMVKVIAHRRKHGDRKALRSHAWHPSLKDLRTRAENLNAMETKTTQENSEGSAGLAAATGSVFEVVDVTSEESYYTMGIFLDLDSALAALRRLGTSVPGEYGDDGDDCCTVEIRERKLGILDWSETGTLRWKFVWEKKYAASDDSYEWRVNETPNDQSSATTGR